MKVEFVAMGSAFAVRVDHELIGMIRKPGAHFVFGQNFVLDFNFSLTQCAEIEKAVADKITLLEITRRILK